MWDFDRCPSNGKIFKIPVIPESIEKMNIILIIVDALRPDHLSMNSYGRPTSPNLDKFAKEGTYFSNAYTSLPRTDPSIMSILTGMYLFEKAL